MSNTISNKVLKLKLNPNSSQYSLFLKFFGCERFVYNFYLNEKKINSMKKKSSLWEMIRKQEMQFGKHLKKLH